MENEDDMGSESLKNCPVLITYSTRPSAERAYVNCRCWQGHNLQFTWVTSSNSNNDSVNKETSSSTSKRALEADVQIEEKLARTVSQDVGSSGNRESENSGESFVDYIELPEVSEHSASPTSSEKGSPSC